ncbi:hypothetical protein BHE74_00018224 [Ensete ventricosum]|nr:hypothetical protein BHE74_00018224 [Ensete ventricosum]
MPRWSSISGSTRVWTEGPLAGEYLRGALHPTLVKQVYECSSEELMNSATKSTIWVSGPSFLSLPTFVVVCFAANKELKVGAGQELVAATERRAKELEETVEKLRAELESLRSQWKNLEQEVRIMLSSLDGAQDDWARLEGDVLSVTEAMTLLEAKLKVERPKVVASYTASGGFESSL